MYFPIFFALIKSMQNISCIKNDVACPKQVDIAHGNGKAVVDLMATPTYIWQL